MAMNLFHRWLCSSKLWDNHVERTLLPWALDGSDATAVKGTFETLSVSKVPFTAS